MADTNTTARKSLKDLTVSSGESRAKDYITWRDAAVREALTRADAHPGQSLPERAVWEKFGLEY